MGDVHSCRHAPPSKRVALRSEHHSPIEMVQALLKQWDPDVAMIFAEWLESQGFPGWAQKLRRKSFETWDMMRVIEDVAGGMGITSPVLRSLDRTRWKRRHKTSARKESEEER